MFRTAEAATDTNWEAVNSAHLEPDPEEFKTADNAPVILDGSPGEDEVKPVSPVLQSINGDGFLTLGKNLILILLASISKYYLHNQER